MATEMPKHDQNDGDLTHLTSSFKAEILPDRQTKRAQLCNPIKPAANPAGLNHW